MTRAQLYYRAHREAVLAKSRRNYWKSKDVVCLRAIAWRRANPQAYRLSTVLNGARARCRRPSHTAYRFYGGRGIQCELTMEDMRFLWARDQADTMKRPSLDRIHNDHGYTRQNCRFIELTQNIQLSNERSPRHGRMRAPRNSVGQFS